MRCGVHSVGSFGVLYLFGQSKLCVSCSWVPEMFLQMGHWYRLGLVNTIGSYDCPIALMTSARFNSIIFSFSLSDLTRSVISLFNLNQSVSSTLISGYDWAISIII